MRLASVAESRRIDELAQKDFGLSSEILMEAAGTLAAREIAVISTGSGNRGAGGDSGNDGGLRRHGPVAVLCGPGGNGGDGLVVARHLRAMGFHDIGILLLAPKEKRTVLFSAQLQRCLAAKMEVIDLLQLDASADFFHGYSVVIDGIFGIGLRDAVRGPAAEWIAALNLTRKKKHADRRPTVIALDAPSGLDADRGVVAGQSADRTDGIAVQADFTLTFGLAKPGFFLSDGPRYVGRLRVLPIGFPKEVVRAQATSVSLFAELQARRALPPRRATTNKANHGRALVLAGSPGMWGAGILAATSAYRVGAGYVTLASHTEPLAILGRHPEIMTAAADDPELWRKSWSAVAIGPGFGIGRETLELIRRLKKEISVPVVVDADAITVIANEKLLPLPSNWTLTPHAGELSRLIGVDAKLIEADRLRYARQAAELARCRVLLKGFHTVIAEVDGTVRVIASGNSALAKAGSGDVLTGMIVGLLAQKTAPEFAAATAAYIHGRIADEWLRAGNDRRSLTAGDLRDLLPQLLARIAKAGEVRL